MVAVISTDLTMLNVRTMFGLTLVAILKVVAILPQEITASLMTGQSLILRK